MQPIAPVQQICTVSIYDDVGVDKARWAFITLSLCLCVKEGGEFHQSEASGVSLTDKQITAAGAQPSAPLSCLDVGAIAARSWLMSDHRVWHLGLNGLPVGEEKNNQAALQEK